MGKTTNRIPEKTGRRAGLTFFAGNLGRRLSISLFLTIVAVVTVLVTSGATSYFSLQSIKESKLKDAWTITFQELERVSLRASKAIETENARAKRLLEKRNLPADGGFFRQQGDTFARVNGGETLPQTLAGSLAFDFKSGSLVQVIVHKKKPYLLVRREAGKNQSAAGDYVAEIGAFPLDMSKILSRVVRAARARLFVVNHHGNLVYSNAPSVDDETIKRMEIVHRFVADKTTNGQYQVRNEDGTDSYAMYYEVPNSNLVLFADLSLQQALSDLNDAQRRIIGFSLMAILVAILLVQLATRYIRVPLQELITNMNKIKEGREIFWKSTTRFGEIASLFESFIQMTRELTAREKKILSLLETSREQARLESELMLAKSIQQNLLPQAGVSTESRIDVSATYIPADEVAGDWYYYKFDPLIGDTIIIIADVSGHGAGSSMFTAIMASVFEEMCSRYQGSSFPLNDLALTLNNHFRVFGKGRWHTTVAAVKLNRDSETMEYLNAGHVPLVLVDQDGNCELLKSPSTPIGFADEITPMVKSVPFRRGQKAVMITDGIIEARNDRAKLYGMKRMTKFLTGNARSDIRALEKGLVRDWKSFVGSYKQQDDACVICFTRI